MTRIFVGGVVGGGALFVVGLAWALGTGSSDPGTRAAPTALGVAIVVLDVAETTAIAERWKAVLGVPRPDRDDL